MMGRRKGGEGGSKHTDQEVRWTRRLTSWYHRMKRLLWSRVCLKLDLSSPTSPITLHSTQSPDRDLQQTRKRVIKKTQGRLHFSFSIDQCNCSHGVTDGGDNRSRWVANWSTALSGS